MFYIGAYANVRLAKHNVTEMLRAIKLINIEEMVDFELRMIENEIKILRQLCHPNIINIVEYYRDNKYIYIVQESIFII